MKNNIVKLFFLILASLPISISAEELSDTRKVPWRNPCSHSDSACQKHYINNKTVDEKFITTSIVDCKEYIFKEKIWELNKEKDDNGFVEVGVVLPEKYKDMVFSHSSLTYGEKLAPILFIDFEPSVSDEELYYSVSFKETNIPIIFEATYLSDLLNETPCYSGSLKIKL